MVCRDLFSKKMILWPGTRSRAGCFISSWTQGLLYNLSSHILFSFSLRPDFTYFSTLLCPQITELSFSQLSCHATPFPCALHTHTHTHTQTHSLTRTHSLRNPDADARNVSAALLTQSLMPSSGPWGGQSHGTWHSCTLLLAWLIFLSWLCSGHPGREPGQLLLIPSLYIRTP